MNNSIKNINVFYNFHGKVAISKPVSISVTETKVNYCIGRQKGKTFEANAEFAYMIWKNLSNGDFSLTRFSKFKTGDTKLDSVIKAKEHNHLFLREISPKICFIQPTN